MTETICRHAALAGFAAVCAAQFPSLAAPAAGVILLALYAAASLPNGLRPVFARAGK